MSELTKFRFPTKKDKDFISTLRRRVNDYFTDNGISKHANTNIFIKMVVMFSLYFLPFAALFILGDVSYWVHIALWGLVGLGAAGIGANIMHDAMHNASFASPRANKLMGLSMNIIGGHAPSWHLQHNVLHHAYTNIEGADLDIDGPPLLRFSPHQKRRKVHKFQHIYAWFLYSLMTLFRTFLTDFTNLWQFRAMGVIKTKEDFRKLLIDAIAWKVIYFSIFLVLPLALLPVPIWLTITGFVFMHLVTGFIMSVVFQCAHILETCEYPLPDEEGSMENNWAVHQLLTTSNFSPTSKWFSWLVGGLNFQVEHHLFQGISHVHYRKISAIVSATADEFGIQYNMEKSFFSAIWNHGRMLRALGRMNDASPSQLEAVPVRVAKPTLINN